MREPIDMPRTTTQGRIQGNGCAMFVAGVVLSIPTGIYRAWAATWLWSWFIVPTFHLPQLTVVQFFGIIELITLLWYTARISDLAVGDDLEGGRVVAYSVMMSIATSTVALVFGWVAHLFL